MCSIATFAGPALGPLVGGYSSYASWRWAFAALAFLSLLLGVLVFFTLPETYPPLLLKREAHRLRLSTGDPRIVSSMEVDARRAAHLPRTARYIERARVIYGRPFVMVSTELILSVSHVRSSDPAETPADSSSPCSCPLPTGVL
jgi:MFS family permease